MFSIHSWGWVYVHIVLDWYTKEIIGHYTSLSSNAGNWLEALQIAVNNRYPYGLFSKHGKPKFISDNGCQPSSEKYMKECSQLKIKHIFTTWNNTKGNADTERVFRTLKEELVWTHDWAIPFQFQQDFEQWSIDYNTDFPHQSLDYKTPAQAMQRFVDRKRHKEVLKHRHYSLISR